MSIDTMQQEDFEESETEADEAFKTDLKKRYENLINYKNQYNLTTPEIIKALSPIKMSAQTFKTLSPIEVKINF